MEDFKAAGSNKRIVPGRRVMKKPKRCANKATRRSRAALGCQSHAGKLLNLELMEFNNEVECNTRKKKLHGAEAVGSCVSCGDHGICKVCLKSLDVMVPSMEAGVEGMWNVVSSQKSWDVPSVVPSHFYKYTFWLAQWPVNLTSMIEKSNVIHTGSDLI